MPPLRKARELVAQTLQLSFRPDKELTPDDVREARDYIGRYWLKVERFHPKDDESLLGLPKPYLVPSYRTKTGFDYNELYYWDSYFMVQGLLMTNTGSWFAVFWRTCCHYINASRSYPTRRGLT